MFGVGRYPGRESASDSPILRNGSNPELIPPTHPFLFWHPFGGRMAIVDTRKVMEGVWRLTKLGIRSDGLKELQRLARYPQRLKYPRAFSTKSGRG